VQQWACVRRFILIVVHCHDTLGLGDHDCKFAADIYAVGPLADHWHYHHSPCYGVPA
jgi:hypothetical protein